MWMSMHLQINILVNEVSQSNDKFMSNSKIVFKKNPHITMNLIGFNKASQSDPLQNNINSHMTTII